MAKYIFRCMGLGLSKGLFAGLLLPVGTALFTLIYSVFSPDSGIPDLVGFVGENLVVAVYTSLFSVPIGALIGLFLGILLGLISHRVFAVQSRPPTRLVLNVYGLVLATAAAFFVIWPINSVLSIWAVGTPDLVNQFSFPGALLTFFFVYASRFRGERWFFQNSDS